MNIPNPQSQNPKSIQFLVLDVDGVLTDGGLYVDDDGKPSKRFHVRDGLGIKLAMKHGIAVAILTGKTSGVVAHRAAELGIEHVIQGSKNKATDIKTLAEKIGVSLEHTAMLGDDLPDLPAFAVCGYAMAVGDASAEAKAAAAFVTQAKGGNGAAREAIEHLLKAQGKWDAAVAEYRP